MANRRRRTGNRSFPKRSTLWLPFDQTIALTTAGTKVDSGDLLGNYFSQTGEEVPIGTTIGPIWGIMTLGPTITTAFTFAYLVEAVLQLNKEGGRATLPTPGVDIIDAMWYGQMPATGQVTEFAAGSFAQVLSASAFTTKAMRKVTGNGQVLIVTAVADQNTDYDFRVVGNLMLRLP